MLIDKKSLILELRNQKKSYQEIGEILGISKQRVHQILLFYRPVPRAVRKQTIGRDKSKCVACGSKKNLEIHHINGDTKDNSKMNLITLCRKCHNKIDKIERQNTRGSNAFYRYGEEIRPKKNPKLST